MGVSLRVRASDGIVPFGWGTSLATPALLFLLLFFCTFVTIRTMYCTDFLRAR